MVVGCSKAGPGGWDGKSKAMTEEEIKAEIENINRRIVAKYRPEKIVLFGSAASARPGTAKDIDLCVIKENFADKSAEFVKIRKILGATLMPLDILIFSGSEYDRRKNIWGTVQYEIDKKGKVLYERGD